jgi:general secretion pathway protein E
MTPAAERRPLLPFVYARAHNIVLLSDGERCEALCRPDTAARRCWKRAAGGRADARQPSGAGRVRKVLVLSYQRTRRKRTMMADIGNELDLYTLAEELPDTDDLLDSEDDAPIIRLINAMLTEAIKEKASDIHIETYERHLQIRFRVDGVLREILRPQRRLAALLISRIKVMASRTLPKSVPQDGRMALRIGGRQSTCASPPCPPATANASSCVCWTKTASTWIC